MRNDSYEFTYNGNSLTVKGSDRTYTCKLNSYGYVTEVTEDNDEKDGAIYYTLEYDKTVICNVLSNVIVIMNLGNV